MATSYRFDSGSRHQFYSDLHLILLLYGLLLWPHGQAVKTSPFHGGIPGSNPGRVTKWKYSSVGRASALQAGGHRFEPCYFHHNIFLILGYFNYGLVVQLVRMPPCHGGGRGFESHLSRHLDFNRDPMC